MYVNNNKRNLVKLVDLVPPGVLGGECDLAPWGETYPFGHNGLSSSLYCAILIYLNVCCRVCGAVLSGVYCSSYNKVTP